MTAVPLVSIVIPTYNHAHFLRGALASVRAQTVEDWEAIIVNNFSEDETIEIVEGFDDARLRLVNFRNNGVIGASRNQGIAHARADWVAFLDSDDLWQPEKLERCLAAADPAADAISHPEIIVRYHSAVGETILGSPERVRFERLLFDGNVLSPSAMMVRRRVLDELGGFSEDPALISAEDFDLWLRMARRGVTFRFVRECLSQYTVHESNSTQSVDRHMAASIAVLERHFGSLEDRTPMDYVRLRRARARAIYGAGRTIHHSGDPRRALRYFVAALREYPVARAIPALALSLGALVGRFARGQASYLLAGWIAAVLAGYLFQFRELLVPIMIALGLRP